MLGLCGERRVTWCEVHAFVVALLESSECVEKVVPVEVHQEFGFVEDYLPHGNRGPVYAEVSYLVIVLVENKLGRVSFPFAFRELQYVLGRTVLHLEVHGESVEAHCLWSWASSN